MVIDFLADEIDKFLSGLAVGLKLMMVLREKPDGFNGEEDTDQDQDDDGQAGVSLKKVFNDLLDEKIIMKKLRFDDEEITQSSAKIFWLCNSIENQISVRLPKE